MRITEFPLCTEVKEEYIKLRKSGKNRASSVTQMKERYTDEITSGAEDDGLLFWIGLADGQHSNKELTEEVAREAISALDRMEQTDWEVTPGDITRRRIKYADAPMPEKKTGKPRPKFQCPWALGDTFAYRMSKEGAGDSGLFGKVLLFRCVDLIEYEPGEIHPVVTISMCEEQELPTNAQEFQKFPLWRINAGRFGAPKGRYEYRAHIVFRNKKQIESLSLQYLGNFTNIAMPENEYFIRQAGCLTIILPKMIDQKCCLRWKMNLYYTSQQDT